MWDNAAPAPTKYTQLRVTGAGRDVLNTQIFPTLDEVRRIVRPNAPGHNVGH